MQLMSATANELKINAMIEENSINQKELDKRQADLEWLEELETVITNSLSDFDFTLDKLSEKGPSDSAVTVAPDQPAHQCSLK